MATASSVEPVFIRQKDLPQVNNQRFDTLDFCLAAERVTGPETILGAQSIRGLWRIYPLTNQARDKLLIDGLSLGGRTIQVHNKNPFILRGQGGAEIPSTKLWLSDIPISISNEDIESALIRLGVTARSALFNERVRNKDGKLTRFLTGRRFMFINVPEKPLEKSVKIGPVTARLYHKGQPKENRVVKCSRCLKEGHTAAHCDSDVVCRVCKQSGHRQGDPQCKSIELPTSDPQDLHTTDNTPNSSQQIHSNPPPSQDSENDSGSDEEVEEEANVGKKSKEQKKQKTKKDQYVKRGRSLTAKKQTELNFETRPRSATPKRSRAEVGDSPNTDTVTEKHARMHDAANASPVTTVNKQSEVT